MVKKTQNNNQPPQKPEQNPLLKPPDHRLPTYQELQQLQRTDLLHSYKSRSVKYSGTTLIEALPPLWFPLSKSKPKNIQKWFQEKTYSNYPVKNPT